MRAMKDPCRHPFSSAPRSTADRATGAPSAAVPRVSTVMDLSRAMGWLGPDQYRTSPRAKPAGADDLAHPDDYVAALEAAERRPGVSDETRAARARHVSNPVYPEMFRRPATAAGASLLAGELLAQGGVIYHPAAARITGFPTARRGSAISTTRCSRSCRCAARASRRIAYVDIDAHHADGVEHGFAGRSRHAADLGARGRRWPFTGALERMAAATA
jgi:acetoin utilization protein AcuC